MMSNALDAFAAAVSADWGPLSTERIAAVRRQMEILLGVAPTQTWLEDLRRSLPANRELIRDPQHGFILQAHTEPTGLYRPPHDHGRSWVIYAVVDGESEMGTYGQTRDVSGTVHLVKRDTTRVKPGQVQVYLPGDIHDTRCVAGPVLLLRFTERDLKQENITRYLERDGLWVAA